MYNLALFGSSVNSYKERLALLRNIFEESESTLNLKIIDAWCNVTFIVSQLLKNAPSAIETVQCSNKKCNNSHNEIYSPTIILSFEKNGFKDLELSLRN